MLSSSRRTRRERRGPSSRAPRQCPVRSLRGPSTSRGSNGSIGTITWVASRPNELKVGSAATRATNPYATGTRTRVQPGCTRRTDRNRSDPLVAVPGIATPTTRSCLARVASSRCRSQRRSDVPLLSATARPQTLQTPTRCASSMCRTRRSDQEDTYLSERPLAGRVAGSGQPLVAASGQIQVAAHSPSPAVHVRVTRIDAGHTVSCTAGSQSRRKTLAVLNAAPSVSPKTRCALRSFHNVLLSYWEIGL